MQTLCRAFAFALPSTGRSKAARMAIMATTTSHSIRLKAPRGGQWWTRLMMPRLGPGVARRFKVLSPGKLITVKASRFLGFHIFINRALFNENVEVLV